MKKYLQEPPTLFVSTFIIEVFLHFYFPIARIIPLQFKDTGIIVVLFAVVLSLWQFFTMNGKTPIPYWNKPRKLITSGPFRFTRNAFYLSIVLINFGVAVYLTSLSPFIAVVIAFIIFNNYFIPKEEKVLENTLGKNYLDYKKRVRRWI